jgi:hypothetical protein
MKREWEIKAGTIVEEWGCFLDRDDKLMWVGFDWQVEFKSCPARQLEKVAS